MSEKEYSIELKWTNINEWKEHINNLRKTYGDNIPLEKAVDFEFVFNDGLGRLCKG